MKHSEMERILRENGFYLKRQSKHPIWTDGFSTFPMPTGSRGSLSYGLSKRILIDIKKAVAARPKKPEPVQNTQEKKEMFNQPKIIADKPVIRPAVTEAKPERRMTDKEIFNIIEPMRKAGHRNSDIAIFLAQQKIRLASGSIVDGPRISKIALANGGIRKKSHRTAAQVAQTIAKEVIEQTERKVKSDFDMIIDIATSNLDDATKRKLTKQLAAAL
jgi:hypothetical protein